MSKLQILQNGFVAVKDKIRVECTATRYVYGCCAHIYRDGRLNGVRQATSVPDINDQLAKLREDLLGKGYSIVEELGQQEVYPCGVMDPNQRN